MKCFLSSKGHEYPVLHTWVICSTPSGLVSKPKLFFPWNRMQLAKQICCRDPNALVPPTPHKWTPNSSKIGRSHLPTKPVCSFSWHVRDPSQPPEHPAGHDLGIMGPSGLALKPSQTPSLCLSLSEAAWSPWGHMKKPGSCSPFGSWSNHHLDTSFGFHRNRINFKCSLSPWNLGQP